jgi:hypothetical protein
MKIFWKSRKRSALKKVKNKQKKGRRLKRIRRRRKAKASGQLSRATQTEDCCSMATIIKRLWAVRSVNKNFIYILF